MWRFVLSSFCPSRYNHFSPESSRDHAPAGPASPSKHVSQTVSTNLLQHLRNESGPLVLRRGKAVPEWSDESVHVTAYAQAPDLYALSALAERVHPAQQARVLLQLLRASRAGLTAETRTTLERITRVILHRLEPEQLLALFLSLRRVRANHKPTRRAILDGLLNHPRLEEMATRRRPALVDCLEHALGKSVARGCARFLREKGPTDGYVRRHLLRFASDPVRVARVVRFLYGEGPCPTPREETPAPIKKDARPAERPKTITATNRGDIAATLVHMYRGGTNADLKA